MKNHEIYNFFSCGLLKIALYPICAGLIQKFDLLRV